MKKFFCVVTAAMLSLSALALGGCAARTPSDGSVLTQSNLSSLVGKTVGVTQLPNVPGLTLRVVLEKYNVDYQIIDSLQAEKATDKVNLLAVDAANITPAFGCDYYLVPEPAATTKINGTKDKPVSLVYAGDLQALYGGKDGYPQAVLVARKEYAGDTLTGELTQAVAASTQYLKTADMQTVLSLMDGARTQGLSPAFTAANFNAEVVKNCSVRYSAAADCKERVNAFLSELIAVNANSAATVQDEFYYTGTFTSEASGKRTVYAPDGAPALALASALAHNTEHFDYQIIDASTVQTKVTGVTPVADYCVLPLNLASKLLGTGSAYQMLGTVTNGNLYFLTVKNA